MSATFSPPPASYHSRRSNVTGRPATIYQPNGEMPMDPEDPRFDDAEAGPSYSAVNTPRTEARNSLGLGGAVARGWKNFAARVGVSKSGEGDESREYDQDGSRSVISGPRSLKPAQSQGQPSPYTPAKSLNDLPGYPPSHNTANDDALDGTTAVGHHENPYMTPNPSAMPYKPTYEPYSNPAAAESEQASVYAAKRSSAPSAISSFGHYILRVKQLFRELNDLPWVADRCTVDYIPGPKEQPFEVQQQQTTVPVSIPVMQLRVPSWYNPQVQAQPEPRRQVHVGGYTPGFTMKQPPPSYGPGLAPYAAQYEASVAAAGTPGPAPQASVSHHSPMPVYAYHTAPPEPDSDSGSIQKPHPPHPQTPYAGAYAVSDYGRVYTPADRIYAPAGVPTSEQSQMYGVPTSDQSQSRVYTPAGVMPSDPSRVWTPFGGATAVSDQSRGYTSAGVTRSDGRSYASSETGSQRPGSPTIIYEQRVTSPNTNAYPYPV